GEAGEEAESADMKKMVRSVARPENNQTPPNPAGRTEQGTAMARQAAEQEAVKNMITSVLKFEFDGKSVRDMMPTKDHVFETRLSGVRSVAQKWIDADNLEIEVEISVIDFANSMKNQFFDANFDPLTKALEGK